MFRQGSGSARASSRRGRGSQVILPREADKAPGHTHREVRMACEEPERGMRNPARALVAIWPADARKGEGNQPAPSQDDVGPRPPGEIPGRSDRASGLPHPRKSRWGQWLGKPSPEKRREAFGEPTRCNTREGSGGRERASRGALGGTVSESWSQVRESGGEAPFGVSRSRRPNKPVAPRATGRMSRHSQGADARRPGGTNLTRTLVGESRRGFRRSSPGPLRGRASARTHRRSAA